MSKRIFIFISSFLMMLFSFASCSSGSVEPMPRKNDPDFAKMTETEWLEYARSVGAITIAEFNKLVGAFLDYPQEDASVSEEYLSGSPIQSAKGYKRYYKLSNIPSQKVYIGDASSGLPLGVYFASAYMVLQEVKCESSKLYISADSPLCGYAPDAINYSIRRGYRGHTSAGYWKMESIAYMVEYDMLGQQINRFYPLLPIDFVWNYQAGTLQ